MVFRWRWTARLQHSECGALPSAADVAREWVVRGDSASPWRPWPAGADAPTSLWRVHLHVYQQLACRVPMRLITDVFSATFSPPRTCCGSNIMSQVWQEPCTLRTFIYSLPSHLFSPSTNIANVASQAPYIQPSPSHCCSSRCSRDGFSTELANSNTNDWALIAPKQVWSSVWIRMIAARKYLKCFSNTATRVSDSSVTTVPVNLLTHKLFSFRSVLRLVCDLFDLCLLVLMIRCGKLCWYAVDDLSSRYFALDGW